MKQYSPEELKAGELLLSNLKIFNEASKLFEELLDPAFWKGFEQCIQNFAEENKWKGKYALKQKNYCWFACSDWFIEGTDYRGWFECHTTANDETDYWLALLTGTATQQGKWGFRFIPYRNYFGGTKAFNTYADKIKREYRTQLIKLGFQDQGKGNFFLPINLNIKEVATCWLEYGDFPDDEAVFDPLREALETLVLAEPIFSSILEEAPKPEIG